MEASKSIPNRTWYSLKERFHNVILKKIDQFEMHEDVKAAFKGIGGEPGEEIRNNYSEDESCFNEED